MRRESVGSFVRENPNARAVHERRKRSGRFDRRRDEVASRREDLRDHALVLLHLEAARRIEQIAAGRQEIRRGGKSVHLSAGELFDARRAHPIPDLRVLPKRAGPAAGSVEQHAVEALRGKRRREEVARDRGGFRHPEPPGVGDEARETCG